ncbi:hypothetical protein [Streptomyces roseicoloratus]|uniref:Secreted protein n=1 Tax=Streptomyces roseicoloratus TaxID=2508722 RepID=A0ABY9RYF4_9ACTN|nr:hypothetical protein [Streptomyces roseicoloratus]WMX47214.1 hypothetical protein RGF97_23680 [Streptomyces roseicoloratus]
MRKLIATAALAAAVVLTGSGTALAHGWDGYGSDEPNVTVVESENTVVVCGDFSFCQGED